MKSILLTSLAVGLGAVSALAASDSGTQKHGSSATPPLTPQLAGGTSALINGSDNCATPDTIIGNGPFTVDSSTATTGSEGQTNTRCAIFNTTAIQNDVWFKWTAGATGWVSVNGCAGFAWDSKVAVYAGSGCPTGEPLTCDDDACGSLGSSSRAAFFATSGNIYTFQIGSYPGQPGVAGSFTIDPFTPVPNDDCATPSAINGVGPFSWDNTTGGTTGTEGQNEVLCTNELITYDLWYDWTSHCSGMVTVTLCSGTSFDTKIAAYSGAGCPTGHALACNDDACSAGGPSTITFNATIGSHYALQIGMWPGEVPGAGTFDIQTTCPPPLGTGYCFGDGTGTACPCGNSGGPGRGCASSVNPAGALLFGGGTAQIAADTAVLLGSGMPNVGTCLYFQGTTQIAAPFGDGLRCTGGTIKRLGTKTNASGSSQYPVGSDPPISVRGMVTMPGTRNYQVWYRNAAGFCTPSTFNLSNGLTILWM